MITLSDLATHFVGSMTYYKTVFVYFALHSSFWFNALELKQAAQGVEQEKETVNGFNEPTKMNKEVKSLQDVQAVNEPTGSLQGVKDPTQDRQGVTGAAQSVQKINEPAEGVQNVTDPAQGIDKPAAVQVVRVEKDHSYYLNQEGLEKILLREDIKDLPVAVVSVAGSYRGGKSFILNFFLRYLNAEPSARSDGTWLGSPEDILTGFSWRGGSDRNTTGILMWSEPFVITLPDGQQVAVLVMDTQGTFDSESTVRDSSTIFAMSTLLSSRQIYNIKGNIKENDLQNLELFTSYGKLMKEQTGNSFQMLEFLLRDWANEDEYAYGQAGGDLYLANKFQVVADQPPELIQLHQSIQDSFEKVTCFLMPHPGLRVGRKTFKGQTKDITEEFCSMLKELVPSIFSPETLCVKRVGSKLVTSRDLIRFFKSYLTIFNSDEIPLPQTIIEVTSEAGLLKAVKDVREQLSKSMEAACGVGAPGMPAADVTELFTQFVTAAGKAFKAKRLFGDSKDIDAAGEALMKELNDKKKDFLMINMSKTMRSIEDGNKAYDEAVVEVSKGQPLCVHAFSVLDVHDKAAAAALKAFSANRKTLPGKQDTDQDKFEKDLSAKHQLLEQINDQSNKALVTELKDKYFDTILKSISSSENICPAPFDQRHQMEKNNILRQFEERRNLPSPNAEDGYRTSMLQNIELQYQQLKQYNASNNKDLVIRVFSNFDQHMTTAASLRSQCMMPSDLESAYNTAKRNAIDSILPKKLCSSDSILTEDVFNDRYYTLRQVNNSANNSVASDAYWAFRRSFDQLSGHWYYKFESWSTAGGYYDKAREAGNGVFYSRRRYQWGLSYTTDEYYRNYVDRAFQYYKNK